MGANNENLLDAVKTFFIFGYRLNSNENRETSFYLRLNSNYSNYENSEKTCFLGLRLN